MSARTALLIITPLITLLLSATAVHAEVREAATLKCRGMKFARVTYVEDHLEYVFKWASVEADKGLEPGECAWLDRVFEVGEPNKLCDAKFAKRPRRVEKIQAPYLAALNDPEKHVSFVVLDEGRGCLAITELP